MPEFQPVNGPQHDKWQIAVRESRGQAGAKENTPLNNNRGGNNRRRGRSNNNTRPQGTSGGQQVNRIDSRARGNAPQMLEKYRKLANDAHLNGDRVNAEYNLQFADHYFRVIADTRVRQEEQRLRRDDRWQEGSEGTDENDDAGEFGVESEFPAFDQPPVYTRREREDRPERTVERTPERAGDRAPAEHAPERAASQSDTRRRDERQGGDGGHDRYSARNNGRDTEPTHSQTGPVEQAPAHQSWKAGSDQTGNAGQTGDATAGSGEDVTAYEPAENPFLRENRGGRGLRPRREDRRPRREDRPEAVAAETPTAEVPAALGETQETDRTARAISAGIDPDTLPPSFTVPRDEPDTAAEAAPAPTPRRRARRKPAVDDTGEPIQSLI